ncbi:MAG: hypothetical protein RIR79_2215 [Pseudomonadota bacterium]
MNFFVQPPLQAIVSKAILERDRMNHCPESKGIKTTWHPQITFSIVRMNHCPESKGIKTPQMPFSTVNVRMNHCPESKGIKTSDSSAIEPGMRMNHCPESKGIKTAGGGAGVVVDSNESLP